MSHCEDSRYTDVGWYNRTGIMSAVTEIGIRATGWDCTWIYLSHHPHCMLCMSTCVENTNKKWKIDKKMVRKLSNLALIVAEILLQPWLREVGVVEHRPVRTSCDVMNGRSNRPRHRKVLYFPHHRQWTMEYSCKVWCRPCRLRPIPRLHSRLSWRLRLE